MVSRKAQGHLTFEIPLPADGLGIEDRDTPTDTIVFHIGGELTSLDSASTSCGTLVSAVAGGRDAVVEIDATGCDGQVITVTINGVHDQLGNFLPTASENYGKLIGDVDGNGVVDSSDAAAVRAGGWHNHEAQLPARRERGRRRERPGLRDRKGFPGALAALGRVGPLPEIGPKVLVRGIRARL